MRHNTAMRYLVTLLVLSSSSVAIGETRADAGARPEIRVTRSNETGVRIVFELGELRTEIVSAAGEEFLFAAIPGGGFAGAAGEPALPVYSRMIAVPEGASLRVRTRRLDVEEIDGVRPLPMQPDEGGSFAYDEAAYAADRPGDEADASVGEPARLRDLSVVTLTFHPVRYDPAARTMKVAHRLEVEVDFQGGAPRKAARSETREVPPSFDKLYQHLVLNYDRDEMGLTVAPGAILVITPDNQAILDSLQPYFDWRKRKGAEVLVATLTETGDHRVEIRDYIRGVYADPSVNLEYVVLAGDAGSGNYLVPTWYDHLSGLDGEGDYPYTFMDMEDRLPDLHIGRLSFGSMSDLSVIVQKTVGYERDPYLAEPDWFTRACVVADSAQSGLSVIDLAKWLKERLLDVGYTEVDTVFRGSYVGKMLTRLDRGDTIFGYRGFGGMSGWSNAYTNVLTNGWKLPFCTIITCGTGSFASGTARSEGFLRAGTLNPFTPKGGIGAVATATNGTHTRYNNCVFYGVFQGLLREEQHSMGASLDRGRIELWLNYGTAEPNNAQIWSHWNNLMGDPVLDVWTAYPSSLAVAHPAVQPLGSNAIEIAVSDGGAPCEEALVCVWKGNECHEAGFTDASGTVRFPLSLATTGDLLLTVTKHDRHPYLATVPVLDTMYVGVSATMVADSSAGDTSGIHDGEINPGETVGLSVELRNFGTETATAVAGTLSTTDPFVTITNEAAAFGDIAPGSASWSLDDFGMVIDGGCPDGRAVAIDLAASSPSGTWHSLIHLDVVSAALAESSHTIADGDNGLLDRGETVEMSVLLRNDGRAEATGLTGTLKSLTSFVTVSDGEGTFGDVPAGGAGENDADRFTLSASPDAYEGYPARLILITRFSGGAVDTVPLTLTVGERSPDDPVGPDGHGYVAYDNGDTAYADAPVYGWIELDPAYGGDGTEIPLADNGAYQDETALVDLPFSFRYYGEDFDQVSVCSNGWVSMGPTPLISYRNWTIPGAGGPDGMIAVFWDNLYQVSESKVFQKNDSANDRWIVEWSRFRNDLCHTVETFEAILYDPAHHPTETGDGMIELQYETVDDCDFINGYATVGLESPDQLDGLLISYWNEPAEGAMPIEAGRAIRIFPGPSGDISTSLPAAAVPATPFSLDRARPNPFNPSTTIAFRLSSGGPVDLAVYDAAGRRVRTLAGGTLTAGSHEVTWDGRDNGGGRAGSGVYFVRLIAGRERETDRIVLIR